MNPSKCCSVALPPPALYVCRGVEIRSLDRIPAWDSRHTGDRGPRDGSGLRVGKHSSAADLVVVVGYVGVRQEWRLLCSPRRIRPEIPPAIADVPPLSKEGNS